MSPVDVKWLLVALGFPLGFLLGGLKPMTFMAALLNVMALCLVFYFLGTL